ncbi:MAG: hypothetical protein EOO04_16915 [Chitinophagaceae bacterium]|nr:MAG: hypothetical protein EOO04_16915 [Chitinophagaceae bacterium]
MRSLLVLLLCLPFLKGQAQAPTRVFDFEMPERKVANSFYNKIILIDARPDTTHLGVIQKGAFNTQTKLISRNGLRRDFEKLLGGLTDASAGNGTLVFQLRKLRFSEITEAMSETGKCRFRANVYALEGEKYHLLTSIDTILVVEAFDVTKKMQRHGGQLISGFLAEALTQAPQGNIVLQAAQLAKIDSIEKSAFAVYNIPVLKDGIYKTFASFRDQTPEYGVIANVKDGRLKSFRVDNGKKKGPAMQTRPYAIVADGTAYIINSYGNYPVTREDGNLYYTGRLQSNGNTREMVAAGVMFGLIGTAIVSANSNSKFNLMVDHLNGEPIRLKSEEPAATKR